MSENKIINIELIRLRLLVGGDIDIFNKLMATVWYQLVNDPDIKQDGVTFAGEVRELFQALELPGEVDINLIIDMSGIEGQ